MKSNHLFAALSFPFLLAACGSVALAPADAPALVLAQDETRECGHGKILLPAGEYRAEVVSPKGTFYKAPKRLRTLGVLIGRSEEGGIFVANLTGNPQALWFGDPHDELDGSPGTLFGAIGMNAPKLWPYTPRILFSSKK